MGFFSTLFGSKSEQSPEDLAKQNEKNFDILKFDGLKAQKMGQIPYSIKCFTSALALKDDFSTRLYLANSYNAIQEYALAMEQLEIMASQNPEYMDTFLMMAKVADRLQNWQAMKEAGQKALQLDDKRAEIFYLLGKSEFGQGDDISAIAQLTKALALDESSADAYLLRSEVLCHMQQFTEAEKDIDQLLALDAENEIYLGKKAEVCARLGKLEEAADFYREVIRQNPFDEPVILELGKLLTAQQKYEEALNLYNEAIENKPDFAEAYKERGNVKMLQGDSEGAAEDLKKSLELAPEEGEQINGEFSNIEDEINARYKAINPFQ